MTSVDPESRASSFDGEVEESRNEIEDQEDGSEKTIQIPQSGSKLSSPSESQMDNPMKDLIKRIIPDFEFSSRTDSAPRQPNMTRSQMRSEKDAEKLLNKIKESWETSDMKYRYDHSVEKLTSR